MAYMTENGNEGSCILRQHEENWVNLRVFQEYRWVIEIDWEIPYGVK